VLSFGPALTRGDSPRVRVVSPYGTVQEVGSTQPGETKTVRFQVRTYGVPGANGRFTVESTRGGVLRGQFTLGNPGS